MVVNCRLKITSERLRTLKGQTKHKAIAETVFTFRRPRALPSLCFRFYSGRPADWEDLQAILRTQDGSRLRNPECWKGQMRMRFEHKFQQVLIANESFWQVWERHKKSKIESMVYGRLTRKSKIIENQKCKFV